VLSCRWREKKCVGVAGEVSQVSANGLREYGRGLPHPKRLREVGKSETRVPCRAFRLEVDDDLTACLGNAIASADSESNRRPIERGKRMVVAQAEFE